MPKQRRSLPLLSFLALGIILSIFQGGAGTLNAEKTVELDPGCAQMKALVTCRAWPGPDAPDIPEHVWIDTFDLDISDYAAAKKVEMASRGGTCAKQMAAVAAPLRGLGASLPGGRLPARWFGSHYRIMNFLAMRGAGLRDLHVDAFEGLPNLQHVELDCNLLERLDPDQWRHNPHIQIVSLEYNTALQLSEDQPLFNSDTIFYLSLTGCGLRTVPRRAFEGMPNLERLLLELNCLRTVPAEALVPLAQLWTLKLGENAIQSLTVEEAQAVARVPGAAVHGNPWRCDCALRRTMHALPGDSGEFWNQAMNHLVCHWPPEDVERPWSVVLSRDSCRECNYTLENATSTAAGNASVALELSPICAVEPQAAATQRASCAGGDATFWIWAAGGVLLLLVLGISAFMVAVLTGRVVIAVSAVGARTWPKTRRGGRERSPSTTANLFENSDYLDDDVETAPKNEDSQRPLVVHFGRRS